MQYVVNQNGLASAYDALLSWDLCAKELSLLVPTQALYGIILSKNDGASVLSPNLRNPVEILVAPLPKDFPSSAVLS